MIDIKSLNLQEMTRLLREMGEPAFRGKQVFVWLHKGVTSFEDMSNLSKPLRQKLAEQCVITVPTVERGFLLVVFWSMEMAGDRPSM